MKLVPYIQQGVIISGVVQAHFPISKLRGGCITVLEATKSSQVSEKVLTR